MGCPVVQIKGEGDVAGQDALAATIGGEGGTGELDGEQVDGVASKSAIWLVRASVRVSANFAGGVGGLDFTGTGPGDVSWPSR